MIAATLIAAFVARGVVGDWQLTDAVVPVVMIAAFPFLEWVIHVCILHWRPRRIGGLKVDPLLARKHREHHVDPRDVPLIFIPWQSLLWVLPLAIAIALLAFPRIGLGLTFLAFLTVLGLAYEWMHYLIHSDYKPKTRGLSGRVPAPPATPLQKRALLVHASPARERQTGCCGRLRIRPPCPRRRRPRICTATGCLRNRP